MEKATTPFQTLSKLLQERIRKFDADNPIDDGGFIRGEVVRDFIERYLNVQLSEVQAEQLNTLSFAENGTATEASAAVLEKILSPNLGHKATTRTAK